MNDRERFELGVLAASRFELLREIELLTPIQDPEFKRSAAGLLTDAYYLARDPNRTAQILSQFHEPEIFFQVVFRPKNFF